MNSPRQHQTEIELNRRLWRAKPLLRRCYAEFYRRIAREIDRTTPGWIVEIGSGIGNLKDHVPEALRTDLFPNAWLDLACDAYYLPFASRSLSHLILFDVFHHLERPAAFLREAARALVPGGRVLLFEPYLSLAAWPAYGLLHHEPVGWRKPVDLAPEPPSRRGYFSAQGNATRLFFKRDARWLPGGLELLSAEAFSSFAYLLSGGYSKPALCPASFFAGLSALDSWLSAFPRIFAARCLIVLRRT